MALPIGIRTLLALLQRALERIETLRSQQMMEEAVQDEIAIKGDA